MLKTIFPSPPSPSTPNIENLQTSSASRVRESKYVFLNIEHLKNFGRLLMSGNFFLRMYGNFD